MTTQNKMLACFSIDNQTFISLSRSPCRGMLDIGVWTKDSQGLQLIENVLVDRMFFFQREVDEYSRPIGKEFVDTRYLLNYASISFKRMIGAGSLMSAVMFAATEDLKPFRAKKDKKNPIPEHKAVNEHVYNVAMNSDIVKQINAYLAENPIEH